MKKSAVLAICAITVTVASSLARAEVVRYPVIEVACSSAGNSVRLGPSSQPDVAHTKNFSISKRDCKSISEAVQIAKLKGAQAKVVAQFSKDGNQILKIRQISSGGVCLH